MPPSKDKYVPKHRHVRTSPLVKVAPRTVLRNTAVASTVAAAATGIAVTTGIADADLGGTTTAPTAAGSVAAPLDDSQLAEREQTVSRSGRRDRADASKKAELDSGGGRAVTHDESLDDASPREIGRALLPEYGFSADQFSCLDALYVSESNWRIDADNPTSSAYGIPQALTSTHDLPADYMTSAEAQIRWGLEYIRDSYGSPCSAWSFKQANNWY